MARWLCRLRFASRFSIKLIAAIAIKEQQQVETTLNIATVACAASLIFPFLAEARAAATATYLTFYSAFAICQAIVAFCKAYYN